MAPMPFRFEVPDAALADLHERLSRTRFPDEPPVEPWSTGTSLAYLRDLTKYWQNDFNWRDWEAKLNAFPQYKVRLGGIDLHYLHVPSKKKDAMPLLISHGWPGSVFEFYKLLPLLTEHFTVVAPSLPGYTLSFAPGQKRFGAEDMADLFAELMTDVLGYKKFGAQGGDWGAAITSILGWKYPERLTGIHLNFLMVPRDPNQLVATPEEKQYLAELKHFLKEETGYQQIQGTRPQTLAYGLSDSPAGLAAWIVEKFHAWTDHHGNLETAVTRDEMLANISLYWFTSSIGSSFWPYFARLHGPWPIPPGKTISVPTAYAAFPREILRPPQSLVKRTYTNIKQWTAMEKGGHFAALEQPDSLAHEVVEFFR
jgi:pimeloyl-ACP methyl ester carboxylesterase